MMEHGSPGTIAVRSEKFHTERPPDLCLRPVALGQRPGVRARLPRVMRTLTNFEHSTRELTEGTVKIYVGNLSHDTTEDDLRAAFEPFGPVDSATVIIDKFTGQPRGFAFVVMPGQAEAQSAIQGLNGKELRGRSLKVNEARTRSEAPSQGGPRRGAQRS